MRLIATTCDLSETRAIRCDAIDASPGADHSIEIDPPPVSRRGRVLRKRDGRRQLMAVRAVSLDNPQLRRAGGRRRIADAPIGNPCAPRRTVCTARLAGETTPF